jgi:N-acetylglutamate synthase-like GNAT family acetyltransferase
MASDSDSTSSQQPADDITVSICAPGDITKRDWGRIESILREGRAVNVPSALEEIPFSRRFVLARRDGTIIGLGAIKRARAWCAEDTQKRAGHSFDSNMEELGYVAVDDSFRRRRLSSRIVDALLDGYSHPLFSTTDSDRMKSVLEHRGFKQAGKPWAGNRSELSLWLLDRDGS